MSKIVHLNQKLKLSANAQAAKNYRLKLKIKNPKYYSEVYQRRKELLENCVQLSGDMYQTLKEATAYEKSIPKNISIDGKIEAFIDILLAYWIRDKFDKSKTLKTRKK